MIPSGYSPAERPKSAQEYQAGGTGELHGEGRKTSSRGAWITLTVVLIVLAGAILLLSLMPEAPAMSTTMPLPPDVPAG